MLVGGVLLFAQPFITNLYADWKQSRLRDELGTAENQREYRAGTLRPGDAMTRLRIPRLGVDTIVVEGGSTAALRAGAGHYPATALPCEEGNAAIAGHRTTYSKPFAQIDDLRPGDRIVLETPVGRCEYRVRGKPWVTHPQDGSVLQDREGSWLTLTTCHPPGSATERLIVRAELV